jgi:nodulation protein E
MIVYFYNKINIYIRKEFAMNIVISGMGAVSAAGIGVDILWDKAAKGISGIHKFTYDWEPHNPNVIFHGGKVTGFNFTDHFEKSAQLLYDPFTAYALVATKEAIKNSGLADDELSGSRTAVIFGTGLGGASTFDLTSYKQYALNEKRLSPFTVPKIMPNAAASHICIRHKINGPSYTIATACASSTQAIGLGMSLIASGIVDRAIVGGSEAMISPGVMRTWEVMRALSPTSIKPFSSDRDGTVLGEGAGMLVLENESINIARNGNRIASIIGYGTTTDGKDIVKPDLEGAVSAMTAALTNARISNSEIDYINAHGTGTILNDANEANAILNVFRSNADILSVSSTKPITGHVLGGTGALEAIITAKAIQNQFIPPTINHTLMDENCKLDITPNIGKRRQIKYAMSNSFAFGGINAVLVLAQ